MLTMAGTAISEDAAAGTETFVNEADKMLLPSKGSCTLQIEGEVFTSPIRGMRMIMSNPVNKGEQTLFPADPLRTCPSRAWKSASRP